MEHEILLPSPGESVTEAEVAVWHKKEGEIVSKDDVLLEVETDKATLEISAEFTGQLKILVGENQVVKVGSILGKIVEVAGAGASGVKPQEVSVQSSEEPAAAKTRVEETRVASPAARKMLEESRLDPSSVDGSGKDGRITKGDVLDTLEAMPPHQSQNPVHLEPTKPQSLTTAPIPAIVQPEPETKENTSLPFGQRKENPVPIPRIRRKIAQRLKEVQNTAAILTTFNEVDMSEILRLRQEYKETFEKRHGIKLGFMGFFVKAAVEALRRVPDVNAEWREDTLVYKSYQDIGVAVSTGKGLVVPVIREAGNLSLAEVEKEIGRLAKKGRDGALGIDDMTGGTFTITNGGVFGSLLSTPILNPPQTAILGMHKTEKRAVVVGNDIVIRPMMYVALTYDHRVIDGKEAVQFLVTIKDCIENPVRVMLEV